MRSVLAAQEAERERRSAASTALAAELRHSATLDDQLAQTEMQLAQAQMQPPMMAPQPLRALPAGWIEQVDQRPGSATHGQTFYVDTATGHTQWEPPAAPPPATAPPPVAPQPQAQQPQPAAGGAVLITVPPGMGPGMRVSKQRPDGGFDWFLIPEGAQPGTQFAGVPIGQQQQPAAAATNPGASMYMQSMLQATASTEQRQQQPAAQQLQPLPAATLGVVVDPDRIAHMLGQPCFQFGHGAVLGRGGVRRYRL